MIFIVILLLTLIWIAGWVILERRKKKILDSIFKEIENSRKNNENLSEQIEELFRKVNDMKNKQSKEKEPVKTRDNEISEFLKELAHTKKPAFVVKYDEKEGFHFSPSDPFEFWYGGENKTKAIDTRTRLPKNKTDYPYHRKNKPDSNEYSYN